RLTLRCHHGDRTGRGVQLVVGLPASAGDLLTQTPSNGGLGLSRLLKTGVILVIAAAVVAYLTVQERKHPTTAFDPSVSTTS
ncbi:MAG: hypothetical protein M3Y64_04935, partial [Gemmatimonadota bacterium]|nr:hypothetical protein [Gemmatimonadota bacterium]